MPPFRDFYYVAKAAGDCAQSAEFYPYTHCAYASGTFNYPPVWMLLGKIGITAADTIWLAVLIELSAIVLLVILLRGYSVTMGLAALPMVLSPSTILGFERANTDIVEWILVCAAALIYSERSRVSALAAFLLLITGVFIKFLALFCATMIVRFRRNSVVISVALVTITLVYLFSITDALTQIRRITPVSPYISFGYNIIFNRFEFVYAPRLGLSVAGLSQSWIPFMTVVLGLVLCVVIAIGAWARRVATCFVDEGRAGTAFLFGASIYCGSFLLLGTNYTYRLIFLLLCLPQFFEWLKRPGGSRIAAQALVACCTVSMWLKFHPELTLHVNQITDWIVFIAFTTILALTALRSLWPSRHDARI